MESAVRNRILRYCLKYPTVLKIITIPKSGRCNSGLLEKPDIAGGGAGCDVLGHLRCH